MPSNAPAPRVGEVQKVLRSSDGTEIFARAVGRSDNPSLVFVHGFAFSGMVWDELFKDKNLLREFYLVSYDMRGHGRSGKPKREKDHASRLYADDFAAVVKAFNLKSPILIGWSLGGTVACDICAYLPKAISGIVYVAGFPYTGPVMNTIATPKILGMLPGFYSTDDVVYSATTKIEFIDINLKDPSNTPVSIKWAWLGGTVMQGPADSLLVVSRVQDPEKLHQAGLAGLPLLLINASADKLIQGDAVEKTVKPYFKDLEVHTVEGGSHVMFYDDQEEFVQVLRRFARRVYSRKLPGSKL
ncbi:hypothetical protein NLJ89_g8999 [Agrocybe chaxingu]|uniref:AB hydrolase-1 domain-containing protein n=1 Tax=Agrocybe chaxingu TaxID=84603 RepID=A0A9W8JTB6_9AGAR|nr:hypothetical protein NLJ89_g8999 [Agrocybe chaxingu]